MSMAVCTWFKRRLLGVSFVAAIFLLGHLCSYKLPRKKIAAPRSHSKYSFKRFSHLGQLNSFAKKICASPSHKILALSEQSSWADVTP